MCLTSIHWYSKKTVSRNRERVSKPHKYTLLSNLRANTITQRSFRRNTKIQLLKNFKRYFFFRLFCMQFIRNNTMVVKYNCFYYYYYLFTRKVCTIKCIKKFDVFNIQCILTQSFYNYV